MLISANFTCNKHWWWLVTWNETQCQRRLGTAVVVVVVVVVSSPPLTGRTPVENRMTSITMPMMSTATTTQMIVQRVLCHHILRRTRWDVFLNVAAFTSTKRHSRRVNTASHRCKLLYITQKLNLTAISSAL